MYGQKTSQNVSYMTSWDETGLIYLIGWRFSRGQSACAMQ